LLDIKKGIVVLTKTDLVDKEWIGLIKEDINKQLSHSFLKDSPIIEVSSVTGKGINELTGLVDRMTMELPERDRITDFRIPVDRVFTISGFGTVITGTLISGTLKEGEACEIYTSGIKTKIRGIQVHEQSVKEAYSGQRVAVNLAAIKTGDVNRGDVITKPGTMESTLMLDCRLKYLKDAPRPLKNRDRVRIYHGTSEILGRIVILDKKNVNPGETALIQIRLESPMASRRGDKYVIRSYSPMITIGGGTILEPNPKRHKVFKQEVIDELLLKEKGNPEDVIEQTIKSNSKTFPKLDDIIKLSGKGVENIESIIDRLIQNKKIYKIIIAEGNVYIHSDFINIQKSRASEILDEYHRLNPLKAGISKEEFKNKLIGKEIKQRIFDELLDLLSADTIETGKTSLWKKGFAIKFDRRQEEIKNDIFAQFNNAKFQPPSAIEILKAYGREEKAAKMVFDSLVDMERLIKVSDDIYITKDHLDNAKSILISFINKSGSITAGSFRDEIGASRKYAVAILEYFDLLKITKRVEDKRILV
jgi:selenocysteine-specific elongation factor